MTQAVDTSEVLKKLDGIGLAIDGIRSDVQDIKLSQTRIEEQFKDLDQRLGSLEDRVNLRTIVFGESWWQC
jgi:hypothetical protein